MAGLLRQAGIRFVVIGGVAANAHGSVRVTWDLDICYDPAQDNRERLAGVLLSWGASLRGADPSLPWVLDARSLLINPVLTLATHHGAIDVMDRVAGVGTYDDAMASSHDVTYAGATFRVLDLDALIAAKRAASRVKDHGHLLELEALREMMKRRGAGRI